MRLPVRLVLFHCFDVCHVVFGRTDALNLYSACACTCTSANHIQLTALQAAIGVAGLKPPALGSRAWRERIFDAQDEDEIFTYQVRDVKTCMNVSEAVEQAIVYGLGLRQWRSR